MSYGKWLTILLWAIAAGGAGWAADSTDRGEAAATAARLGAWLAAAEQRHAVLETLRAEGPELEERRRGALRRPWPELEAEVENGLPAGAWKEYGLRLGISQSFDRGGQRARRADLLDRERAVLDARLREVGVDVRRAVQEWFWVRETARQQARLLARQVELARELTALARTRWEAGEVAEMDVHLAAAEIPRWEGRRREAEREAARAQAELMRLAGGVGPDEPVAGDHPLTRLPAPAVRPDLDAGHPQLARYRAEVEQAVAEADLVRAEGTPDLVAGVFYARQAADLAGDGVLIRQRDQAVGIRLHLPLPSRGRNESARAAAAARTAAASRRWELARRDAGLELAAAWDDLGRLADLLKLVETETLPSTAEALALALSAYRLGETDILPVLAERRRSIEAEGEHAALLGAWNTAVARLEAAAGGSGSPLAATRGGM